MLTPSMKSLINQLWDKFWSGGISNPLTAIEQISYLLFMRRLDELDAKQKSDAEFTGDKYISIFEKSRCRRGRCFMTRKGACTNFYFQKLRRQVRTDNSGQ
jgi:hypothetical protein